MDEDRRAADRMTGHAAQAYPMAPYPGGRPRTSYVQVGRLVLPLPPGEAVDGRIDLWLGRQGSPPLSERRALLCYGSNACPSKLLDLRARFRLRGPVVMTACVVTGLAAAWCTGRRALDGVVPATLVAFPGSERHFLWWVARTQWAALDRCEGRRGLADDRYRLVRLDLSDDRAVVTEDGTGVSDVLAYVGCATARRPLADARGQPLLVREHAYGAALAAQAGGSRSAVAGSLGRQVPGRPAARLR